MAFAHLFHFGRGDFTVPRLETVSCFKQYARYLLKYHYVPGSEVSAYLHLAEKVGVALPQDWLAMVDDAEVGNRFQADETFFDVCIFTALQTADGFIGISRLAILARACTLEQG